MSKPGRGPSVEPRRRQFLLLAWLATAGVVTARSAELQVVEGEAWREIAAAQHRMTSDVAAHRGTIVDRNGVSLAVSRASYRVSVAPSELVDAEAARDLLVRALGLTDAAAIAYTDPDDPWHVIPGRFEPAVAELLGRVRGIHLERVLERLYPHGEIARAVLGRVLDGSGSGGIEQTFDEALRGHSGRQITARNSDGQAIPGGVVVLQEPVAGANVRLTLDLDLQEIAYGALVDAVKTTGARGGDILVSDPSTGEILALASVAGDGVEMGSAVNTPYEPGSTLKPFTVAAILSTGAGTLADEVDTEGGTWVVGGRALHDVSDHGTVTLAEALRVSSNVGIAKAAAALTPRAQFENLRDFGFGVPTGIELPGEVAGTLRRPGRWSSRSQASLAIGYEVSVTPVQMAMAYGALANGGLLMEPHLMASVSGPGGASTWIEPRVVRRAAPETVTRSLSRILVDVVDGEGGTGSQARMSSFEVAGKSGTSWAYVPSEGYRPGRYFASFVGYFPAEDPQLVIFVKLDSPDGEYYGGATAAPVTRATMEAVLATRQAPVDRAALLKVVRASSPPDSDLPGVRFASLHVDGVPPEELPGRLRDVVVDGVPDMVALPDLAGLPARVAARRLHAMGFRVRWDGQGNVAGTQPAAGSVLFPGDTVLLRSGRGAG
ncbi:MAG TPA: penicillin-binding transpeptidase domain-containing protein [Longimicrobiales bacterium]